MKKKRFSLFMVIILLFAIVLYGCGGKKQEGNDDKTPASEQSDGTPHSGGTVVVGIQQDLDSLDPHKAVAAGTKEVLFNVFEGLVKPDKDGNLVPAVAESYVISEDGTIYTFKLRKDVKFHNGNAVTANDVVYSIQRSAGLLKITDPSVVVESALTNILEVNKVDDSTVELILQQGDTELIGYLTSAIIPKDYAEVDSNPVGTGPFKFVSYKPLESLVVEKNTDYYFAGEPYLDKVTFKIISNTESAMIELMAGTIDIYPYLTDAQAEQLKARMNVLEGNMNLVQALFLNNGAKPFDDVRVRKALAYAIDRKGIIDMVAGGKGSIIGSNMFVGFGKYYDEQLELVYNYNIAKAKELLTEAGYQDGFSFTITVPSNYSFHVDTAQVIVEQLRAIGVTATIKQIEWASWISDVYQGRNYESTIIGLDAKLAARDVLERYDSTAGNNFVNYKNEIYDEVLKKAIESVDEDEKVTHYKELQHLLTNDAASVYLQDPALLVAVNPKLEGYTFYPVYILDMSKIYFVQ